MSSLPNDAAFVFLQDIAANLAKGDITFPTFAAATLGVRTALLDSELSAEGLARVVMREPLLSAKLVRIANSAALNPAGRPIGDVKSAVIRVGHNVVRSVAVAVALDQLRAERDLRQFRDRAEAAWRHSVRVAAFAHVIAGRGARLNADEALFAGLIHDIGYFYLLSRAAHYPDLEGHPDILDSILAEWHPAIGRAVMHSFALPDPVLDGIAEHETGHFKVPPRSMADVLALANLAAAGSNPVRPAVGEPPTLQDPAMLALIDEHRDEIQSLIDGLNA